MAFQIKRNDTSPQIEAVLSDASNTAINLTGAAVRFHMRRSGASTTVIDAAASIINEAAGRVKYVWQAADTANVGSYQCEFEVTYPDDSVETFPNDGYIRVDIISDIA